MNKLGDEDIGGGVGEPGTEGGEHPGRHEPGEGGAEGKGDVAERKERATEKNHLPSTQPVAEQAATEASRDSRVEVGGGHGGGGGEVLGHPLLHQLGDERGGEGDRGADHHGDQPTADGGKQLWKQGWL